MKLRVVLRVLKWFGLVLPALILMLLIPVGYIEAFCRSDPQQTIYKPIITDQKHQRKEANSYLTYPEWHIVYAYEGLANVLRTGDEHAFNYSKSIGGFWSSYCELSQTSDRHGVAETEIRQMVHVIGVSFTMEMALKALYEETLGRLFAWLRGDEKTPEDLYATKMADDYAKFLHQVPWYKYDFTSSIGKLYGLPTPNTMRGWERRLALGGEWWAKSRYAKLIAGAAAAQPATLRIRSVVKEISATDLATIEDVTVIENVDSQVLIETPRYRRFTEIIQEIGKRGGQFVEIAGNDDIMVSATIRYAGDGITYRAAPPRGTKYGKLIAEFEIDGFSPFYKRKLIDVKVADLVALVSWLNGFGQRLEHIYDF